MKPLLLLGCIVLASTTLRAQFSFLPYAGFERSRTTLSYSDLSSARINGNLKAGLKMDYRLKGGHSPFINLTTSPAPVSFAFDNAGSLLNTFRQGGLRFRLEGGYQYSSKPIQLGKRGNSVATTPLANSYQKQSCGAATYVSHCCAKRSAAKTMLTNKTLNMRLQPSLALAYIPSTTTTVKRNTDGFEYAAGTWKTALVPAMGFEFANGRQRLFTLTAFYTHPLGQKAQAVTTAKEGKISSTSFQAGTSSWGLTLGIPFGFSKHQVSKVRTERKSSCGGMYYRRCMRLQ